MTQKVRNHCNKFQLLFAPTSGWLSFGFSFRLIHPRERAMPCVVPFTNSNLDTSFFVLKPIGAFEEDLVEALKYFCFCSEDQGCTYSSIVKSIHGNKVIWYGAWMKRSDEKMKLLTANLKSAITSLSSMATLENYGFIEAYGGESKDGHPAAKFSSGDILYITSTLPISDDLSNNLSYAYLALQRSWFLKMEGASSGVCFRCYENPMVASVHVWKSLRSLYSWLLSFNHRETIQPFLNHLSLDFKYDVFQVIYVNNDDILNLRFFPPPNMISSGDGSKENKDLGSPKDSKLKL